MATLHQQITGMGTKGLDAMLRESSRATDMLDRLEQSTICKAFRGGLAEPQRMIDTKLVISQ